MSRAGTRGASYRGLHTGHWVFAANERLLKQNWFLRTLRCSVGSLQPPLGFGSDLKHNTFLFLLLLLPLVASLERGDGKP